MPRKVTPVRERRRLLRDHVTSLTRLALKQFPGAEVEVSFECCEDTDAHIQVCPAGAISEEEQERLAAPLTDQTIDILLDTGLGILVSVHEPGQRPRR